MESETVSVISDLHLFTHRSTANRYQERISQAAEESDVLVLNGDIVDFKWSTLGRSTIPAAKNWLRCFCEGHPNCRIIYVAGNHDALAEWATQCEKLAADIPNLVWSPDYFRVDSLLLTHGDLLLGRHGQRHRRPVNGYPCCSRLRGRLYAGISAGRLPRAVGLLYGPQRCARLARRNLADLPSELISGIDRLCIGHTHIPFTGIEVDGIRVSNTGSAVRGMKFNLLQFRCNTPAAVLS